MKIVTSQCCFEIWKPVKTELTARQDNTNETASPAAIHTADEELTKEFGKAVKAIRVTATLFNFRWYREAAHENATKTAVL